MTIVLPDEGAFQSVLGEMDNDRMAKAVESTTAAHELLLRLPKFSFTFGSLSLKDPLVSIGMVDAFEKESADFTGIAIVEQIYISDVIHKAFMGIDEYGTEAAAVTAVIIDGYTSVPPELIVDRPFLFFIRDTQTGVILFAGQVTDPSQTL